MLPIEPITPVEGNKECCELLEGWLKRARLGEINCVALAASVSPTIAFMDHAGVNTSHFAVYTTIDQLKQRLVANILPSAPHVKAPAQSDISANLVAYDINNEPLQFDFLPWLVTAEMTRIREGASAPLHVKFIRGHTNIEFSEQELVSQDYWLDKVLIPMCRMIGAEVTDEGDEVALGRRSSCYSFVEIVQAVKAGEPVPRLQITPGADEQVRKMLAEMPCAPIVITLREAQHFPHRNSNPVAWLLFARELQQAGEQVIVVRDTAHASDPFISFATCPAASRDLDIRVALYERAKCNFFVDNGPFTLALMGRAPWLAFVNADPMTGYIANTPQWWKRNHGVAVGEQFPWSGPHQRIVWQADTFDNLRNAWNEFAPTLAKAA